MLFSLLKLKLTSLNPMKLKQMIKRLKYYIILKKRTSPVVLCNTAKKTEQKKV